MNSLLASQAIQGVRSLVSAVTDSSGTNTSNNSTKKIEISSDFEGILKAQLSPNAENSINEEELYAAVLGERIKQIKGDDAFEAYKTELAAARASNTRSDGVVAEETSANQALSALVSNGTLSSEEMGQVKAAAFKAAQLDDNENLLYDGRGSASDPTIAIMNMEEALAKAKAVLEKISSGEVDLSSTPSSEISTSNVPEGTSFDGEKRGFIFKPESDSDGNLVVLLPAMYSNLVSSVNLKDPAGELLDSGRSTGLANPDDEGDREHFRFSKPGGGYPKDIKVEITLNDGRVVEYSIPDPSQRYD